MLKKVKEKSNMEKMGAIKNFLSGQKQEKKQPNYFLQKFLQEKVPSFALDVMFHKDCVSLETKAEQAQWDQRSATFMTLDGVYCAFVYLVSGDFLQENCEPIFLVGNKTASQSFSQLHNMFLIFILYLL